MEGARNGSRLLFFRPTQSSSSELSGSPPDMLSDVSCTGDEITYAPLAHLPRSIRRQRSLQNGNSGSLLFTGFLQVGHRNFRVCLRAIDPYTILATRS